MTLLQTWVRTPLPQAAGWALFHSLWEGAVVAALLAATLTLLRPARARYTAACVALASILASFLITFWRLLPVQPARAFAPQPVTLAWMKLADLPTLPAASVLRLADLLGWLAPLWMAGVVIFYFRHLAGWTAARRMQRTGVCCVSDHWQQRLVALAGRLHLARPVLLLESCLAGVPVVIGHVRPVILMPLGLLTGFPAGQIELILLHELAHIRRRDYLVNMLQTCVEGLLFYHPAVWWISGIIRAEREHTADDLAVETGGDAHAYATALAALERSRSGVPEAALAATGGNLVKRVRRLLIPQKPSSALTPVFAAGVLMLIASVALTAWQTKTPQPRTPEVSPYTKWLEEDAAYIITDAERAAFERLQTDGEREKFIEQFWLRRDPTPGTPENEFQQEHYRRIQYANDHFASTRVGWKTDRGRIYIMFGPPDEREMHPKGNATRAYPFDVWRYRFIEGIGRNVWMEFVDSGSGEYRMTRDPNPPR